MRLLECGTDAESPRLVRPEHLLNPGHVHAARVLQTVGPGVRVVGVVRWVGEAPVSPLKARYGLNSMRQMGSLVLPFPISDSALRHLECPSQNARLSPPSWLPAT